MDGRMSNHDLSWMNKPAVFDEVVNAAGLSLPANTPIGHRAVVVDKIFEDIEYLPAHPHLSGLYICADLLYPAMRLGFSVFELYHSQTGVNLRPKLYVTKTPVVGVVGTEFEKSKNAHRILWVSDDAEAMRFIDFITSYIFLRSEKREAMSSGSSVLPVQYPIGDGVDRRVSCVYLVPFSTNGGYIHDQMASTLSPYPLFVWQAKEFNDAAKALSVQAEAAWRSS
jgi:hypothetical protein